MHLKHTVTNVIDETDIDVNRLDADDLGHLLYRALSEDKVILRLDGGFSLTKIFIELCAKDRRAIKRAENDLGLRSSKVMTLASQAAVS